MSEPGRPARESLGTTATGPSGTSWVSVGASPRDPLATASFVAFLLLAATISGPIAPMGIATALCGVLTLLRFARSPRPVWPRTPVDRAALAWLAALVLVSAFALDPVGSFPRVSKGLMPALVGLAALHAGPRTDGRRALAVYLAAAGLVAAAGLGMWVAEGASYAWRARGLSHHYMTFGGQLLLELPVALAVALTARSARWRWGAGAVALLTFASLATTFTRSAWMGAFVSGLVVLAGVWPWGLAFLAGGALAAWFGAQGEWRDRLHSMVDPSAGYNGERLLMWGAGWRMFKADPLTGVGLQDLHAVYPMYRSPLATEEIGHLHNTYVQIAATMGLAGLAAFAWLYASLMRAASAGFAWGRGLSARLRAEGEGAGLRLGVTAALVGFLVAGLFEWNFGDEELLYHLYVLVGLAWASRGWARPEDGRPRLAPIDRTTCDRPDRGERSGEVVGRENVLERRTQRAWSHALLVGDRARRALRAPSIVRKVTALADLDGRIESPCIPALIPKTLNGSSSCSPRETERPAGNPERSFQDPGWFTVYEEFALRSRTAGL